MCSEEFELLDLSYSVLDIEDYFVYILKKHGKKESAKPKESVKKEKKALTGKNAIILS